MWLLFLIYEKKLRFLKFSFFEIYGNVVAEVMVDKVKNLLVKLNNFYFSIHSLNVQEQNGSERTKSKVMLVIHM